MDLHNFQEIDGRTTGSHLHTMMLNIHIFCNHLTGGCGLNEEQQRTKNLSSLETKSILKIPKQGTRNQDNINIYCYICKFNWCIIYLKSKLVFYIF